MASNDDATTGSHSSLVSFKATANTSYHIAVDGFSGTTGTVSVAVSFLSSAAPANNSFASRIALTGSTVSTSGTNVGATKETGEPNHAGNGGGKSVWWTWTPTASGTVSISTANSSYDTLLGVYTGTTVSALTKIASNDDVATGSHSSLVSFAATRGTAYQIALDGFNGASGTISLSVNLTATPAPSNNNFAGRIALQGRTVTTSGTNINATKETGEPNDAGNAGGASVWWSWIASGSGTATVSTAGSSFTPLVGIYTGTTTVSALTPVATTSTGLVTFSASLGTTYQIAVDGSGGVTGNIKLSISGPAAPSAAAAVPTSSNASSSASAFVPASNKTTTSTKSASAGSNQGSSVSMGSISFGSFDASTLNDVAWNGSLYVAVGVAGRIITSPDGIDWKLRQSGTTANLLAVMWDGVEWVVVGTVPVAPDTTGSVNLISPDGVVWTVSGP